MVGENGHGKSNILEAIHFLSVLRSYRCNQIKNLFRWNHNYFHLIGDLKDKYGRLMLEVNYGAKRRLAINGATVPVASEFMGQFYCTAFSPEDIRLIHGPASERRRFLDMALAQNNPAYMRFLQDYNRALKSRNVLLRMDAIDNNSIDAFSRILVDAGTEIIHARNDFCRQLESSLTDYSGDMFRTEDRLTFGYHNTISNGPQEKISIGEIKLQYNKVLLENLGKDIQYGMTLSGPHRDDISMLLNRKKLQEYGSEGQCRLAVMALKLASGDLLLKKRANDAVIFVVDDVFGELDDSRKLCFLNTIKRARQVFLACTDKNTLLDIDLACNYVIRDGTATKA